MSCATGSVDFQAGANLIGNPLSHQTKNSQFAAGNGLKIIYTIGAVIYKIKSPADLAIVCCALDFFLGDKRPNTCKSPNKPAVI